jgi:hypothetical protein
MKSLQENMMEYKKQLEKGAIQKAYLGLMEYMIRLKTHFKKEYPGYVVSGSLYFWIHGYDLLLHLSQITQRKRFEDCNRVPS